MASKIKWVMQSQMVVTKDGFNLLASTVDETGFGWWIWDKRGVCNASGNASTMAKARQKAEARLALCHQTPVRAAML